MLDALSHLSLFASVDAARAHLQQGARDGVVDVITAGTDPRHEEAVPSATSASSATSVPSATSGTATRAPRVHRAFGIHPHDASDDALAEQMRALEGRLEGAVAIGECGFDHRPDQPPLEVQERALRAQLALARARKLPVILHLVRAWSRALDIIDEDGPLPAGGVWHAFAGPSEAIARAAAVGLGLSIGGLVLNAHSRRLHEALPHIPAELLLVETDMPHDPAVHLRAVVDEVARLRGEDGGEVAKRTQANGRRIFRIPG